MPFFDIDFLRLSASGRWSEILTAAGIPARVLDGRHHPCPRCGGRDRFSVFADFHQRGAVHCRKCFTRGCGVAPSDGIATLRWWSDLSFLESLSFLADTLGLPTGATVGMPALPATPRAPRLAAANPRMIRQDIDGHTDDARQAYRRMDDATRRRLARRLFVSTNSLISLRVGLTADGRCSTWPMRDEHGDVIGVRISSLPWANAPAAKWSRPGSQSGIFLPRLETADRSTLYVTEGASDTAAALSLGLWAIGRASCSASSFFIDQFIHQHPPSRVVIVADNDSAGRDGANRLAKSLCQTPSQSRSPIEVITPPEPAMDLRAWVASGAKRIQIDGAETIAIHRRAIQTTFDFVS
jgi:hypothetical protein